MFDPICILYELCTSFAAHKAIIAKGWHDERQRLFIAADIYHCANYHSKYQNSHHSIDVKLTPLNVSDTLSLEIAWREPLWWEPSSC